MPNELAIAVIEDDPSFRSALVERVSARWDMAREVSGAQKTLSRRTASRMRSHGHRHPYARHERAGPEAPARRAWFHAAGHHGQRPRRLRLRLAAGASGAVCLLQKPFAMDALIDCLEQRSNF